MGPFRHLHIERRHLHLPAGRRPLEPGRGSARLEVNEERVGELDDVELGLPRSAYQYRTWPAAVRGSVRVLRPSPMQEACLHYS